jgi:hypothetical protein
LTIGGETGNERRVEAKTLVFIGKLEDLKLELPGFIGQVIYGLFIICARLNHFAPGQHAVEDVPTDRILPIKAETGGEEAFGQSVSSTLTGEGLLGQSIVYLLLRSFMLRTIPMPMRYLVCVLMRQLLLACTVFFICLRVNAETLPGDVLAHLRTNHPRLLMTDDQLVTALAAAKTDPLRAELNERIIATAEHILTAPPVRYNNDKTVHEQERYAVYYILTCAMAYRLTGDERFYNRAKNDLFTVAAFPDWDPTKDLSEGEMSFAVAIGYDWLYAKLKPDERAILKQALLDKSLSFADDSYRRTAGWTKGDGNHNQVCNAGMVSAALALADEQPDLARRVIAGACISMRHALSVYAPDGSFPEGPGYWTYGTTYSVITFAELESALGTDLGFTATPGFANTINYYEAVEGPFGPVFNYADATDDLQNSPARAWLAKRFGSPFALHHTRLLLDDFLQQNAFTPFDRGIQGTVVNRFFALHEVWFPNEPEQSVTNPPLDSHFRGIADIATFRSAWNDTNAIFVGFKAGDSAAGHGHLDLGSFVMDAAGQRWAMDLGPDTVRGVYSLPGYFDVKKGRRWTYFRVNNHSHNTVTPGDALQDPYTTTPIIAFGSTPKCGFAIADLTPAYPEEAVSLYRGIALLDGSRVLVQDEYQPAKMRLPLHWVMVTRAKIDLSDNGHSATLTSHGRTLRVDLLEPTTAAFRIGSTKPPTPEEMQNDGTAMLAIDVNPTTDGSVTRLAVLLTPLGDEWPKLNPPAIGPLAKWR